MNTSKPSEHNTPAVVANPVEMAEGLFVLELEERLEMATVAPAGDRCIIVNH